MTNVFDYKKRLPANFITDKVEDLLPEYFPTEYPNIVSFLKKYYDYMEKDHEGFSYVIQTLYQARSISDNTLAELNNVLFEIGNGTQGGDFFADSRNVARLFSTFYRLKGSKLSAESFFRSFYGEEVEVVFPKNNMFIVNESRIGSESLRFIQDDKRYQIHSVLIRSGVALRTWQALYKTFVHPAGFYLAGDTIIEQAVTFTGGLPDIIPDSAAGVTIYEAVAAALTEPLTSLSRIRIDDGDADLFSERMNIEKEKLSYWSSYTLGFMASQYGTIIEAIDMNGPTFDEDSDGISRGAVGFSSTAETMDQSIFDYWDSDNNTFHYQDSA